MLHKFRSLLPWLICIPASLFYSYEYLLRVTPALIKAQFMLHHNIGPTTFGFIASLYYLAYTPMQLVVGILIDNYGPKKLLTASCVICVFGIYMFASNSLYIAGTGLFFVGLGSAFAFVGVLKLATIWLPPDRLAMISGFTSALGKVAAMSGNLTVGALVMSVSWSNILYGFAVFGFFLAIFMFILIKDKNPEIKEDRIDLKGTIRNFKYILSKKQIWLNGIISSLIYLPTTIFANLWGRTYLIEAYNFTDHEAGRAISILFAGFAIGAPLAGYISDKLRLRRMPIIIGSFFALILFTSRM
jgi:sugar phosphate permease